MEISAPIQGVSESRKPHLSSKKLTRLASEVVLAGTLLTGAAALAACDGTETGGQTQINSGSSGAGGSTPDNSGSSGSGNNPNNGLNPDGTISNRYNYCAARGLQLNPATEINVGGINGGVVPFTFFSSTQQPNGGFSTSGFNANFPLIDSDFAAVDGVTFVAATSNGQMITVDGANRKSVVQLPAAKFFAGQVYNDPNIDLLQNPMEGTYATGFASLTLRYPGTYAENPFGNVNADAFSPLYGDTTPNNPVMVVVEIPPCDENARVIDGSNKKAEEPTQGTFNIPVNSAGFTR